MRTRPVIDPLNRSAGLSLAMVLAVFLGCEEPKTKVTFVDLKIDLLPCWGKADGTAALSNGTMIATTCRDQIGAAVLDAPVNACLLVIDAAAVAPETLYIPLRYADGVITPTEPASLNTSLTVGLKLKAEMYFFGAGFRAGLCGGEDRVRFGSVCDKGSNFCVLKLNQPEINFTVGGTSIDFRKNGECQVQWDATLSATIEACDGADNDCDLDVDEDVVDDQNRLTGAPCTLGEGYCEAKGKIVCEAGAVRCNADEGHPRPETCNNVDDNCSGVTDEGLDQCCSKEDMQKCGVDKGICLVGSRTCIVAAGDAKGMWGPCEDADGVPVIEVGTQAETCDDRDEDCDGRTDEDFEVARRGRPLPCVQGVGICQREGIKVCNAAQNGVVCDAEPADDDAQVEACDALDNDCDGLLDEGFMVGAACMAGVGACLRTGTLACLNAATTQCVDGAGQLVVSGAPVVERCADMIDGDCDGDPDNGFTVLGRECPIGPNMCERRGSVVCDRMDTCDGNPANGFGNIDDDCFVGIGVCRQQGSFVCDRDDSTRTSCSAVPADHGAEICDGLDNDCDGDLDEDIDTESDLENCGGCGNVCNLPHSVPVCTEGVCMIFLCTGGYQNHDSNDANGCECNGEDEDLPDPDFMDANCDNVDGDRDDAVFVSDVLGHDSNDLVSPGNGSISNPFRRLEEAVTAAGPLGKPVFLDQGTYSLAGNATLRVPSGVSLHGGYSFNEQTNVWDRRHYSMNRSIIRGAPIVLRYLDVNQPTILDNVIIVADPAQAEMAPSIGVHATNVGDRLLLRDVEIRSAAGGVGTRGIAGVAAALQAQQGLAGAASNAVGVEGTSGAGGLNAGCVGSFGGGSGGNGARASNGGGASVAGQSGAGGVAFGGLPGVGGGNTQSGQPGGPGGAGMNGPNSIAGNAEGIVRELGGLLVWQPRSGLGTVDGTPGGGGGGGGGGGALNLNSGVGGGGGGGGAGGCAGRAGQAPVGGGGSFALHIVGGHVALQNVMLFAGPGATGGAGGAGSAGATGATGGFGGGHPDCMNCGSGGDGGWGGIGGCGGHAGGGAGGPTFAVLRVAPPSIVGMVGLPSIDESNVVFLGDDGAPLAPAEIADARALSLFAGEPGVGGDGGARNLCGDPAASGPVGFSGDIGCCRRSGAIQGQAPCGVLTTCD